MIHVTNSTQRLKAAANMVSADNSIAYCAGVYSIPECELHAYLSGLSDECPIVSSEINEPLFADVNSPEFKEVEQRVHAAYTDALVLTDEDTEALIKATAAMMHGATDRAWDTPVRVCPYPTKGHLSMGGVQGHSAGEIFPYMVVVVGGLDDHDYHVIGNGLKLGDEKFGFIENAFIHARELLARA